MDKTACVMLNHYRKNIETRTFDQYDIYAFLIFIREYLPKGQCEFLRDIGDMIAHRNRNKGKAIDTMKKYIDNNKYSGCSYKTLSAQIKSACNTFNIAIDKIAIREIILCIIALSNHVEHKNENVNMQFRVVRGEDNKLGLISATDDEWICYMEYLPKVSFTTERIVLEPFEALRENGEIILKFADGSYV